MCPLHGLGRCDGHHETVDLRLGKMTRPIQQVALERKPRTYRGLKVRKKHLEGLLGHPTLAQGVRLVIKKGLRNAAIAFSYRHYVAAYLAGWVHRAVPPNQNR